MRETVMKMAVVVRYCTEEGGKWRTGVTIVPESCSCEIGIILDIETMRPVDEVWNFNVWYIYGAMILPPDSMFTR